MLACGIDFLSKQPSKQNLDIIYEFTDEDKQDTSLKKIIGLD